MQQTGPSIKVDVRHDTNTSYVEVSGEVDLATAPHLDVLLSDLTAPKLVIDLRGVDFIDSTGLHCLIRARARYDGQGKIRLIVRRPGHVIRLLELADLVEAFDVEEERAG